MTLVCAKDGMPSVPELLVGQEKGGSSSTRCSQGGGELPQPQHVV